MVAPHNSAPIVLCALCEYVAYGLPEVGTHDPPQTGPGCQCPCHDGNLRTQGPDKNGGTDA